jgi:hypothetical protein
MCRDLLNDKVRHAFLSLNLVLKSVVCRFCNHEASGESATGSSTTEQLPV